MSSKYESRDFYLAGFLMSSGIPMVGNYKEGYKTTFVFNGGDEVERLVNGYYSMQETIEPVSYGQALRNLKSIIHSITNSESDKKFKPINNNGSVK